MTASSDVELMRWAAKALESLCAGDTGGVFSEAAAEAGALESLVLALRHHNDPESLRCLAATLSTLLSDDPGLLRLRAVEAGVLETLVSALRINRNDPESLRSLAIFNSYVKLPEGNVGSSSHGLASSAAAVSPTSLEN